MVIWNDFRMNGSRRIVNISPWLGARFGCGAMRISGWKSALRWSGSEKLSSLVFLLLLLGKRRTQNLQNRQYSPFTAARATKYNSWGKFTFGLKKNTNFVMFPYKSFKYRIEQIGSPVRPSIMLVLFTWNISEKWNYNRLLKNIFFNEITSSSSSSSSSSSRFISRRSTPPSGFYLGFIVWGRSPGGPKGTRFLGGSRGMPPRKFFEMNMRRDVNLCILRHNFEITLQWYFILFVIYCP